MTANVSSKRLFPLLGIVLLSVFAGSSPASAHGTKTNVGGSAYAWEKDVVTLSVNDNVKDGHCATGRAFLDGRWKHIGTDCTHGTQAKSFEINASEGSWLTLSVCVGNHTGHQYCYYSTQKVQYGATYELPYWPGDQGR